MSNLAQHYHTYSQSGFSPPSYSGGGVGVGGGPSTLERAQRSRSFDHRRDFWGGASPRAHFVNGDKLGANGFFNKSVTIPIQQSVDASTKRYRSAVELNSASAESQAAAEDEWTSYDRTVRYSHNRTELPAVAAQRALYEYSPRRSHSFYGGNHHPVQYALRHSDDEKRRYEQQYQQQPQEQQYHKQQQQSHGESYYRSQHQSNYGRHNATGGRRSAVYLDEDYAAGTGGGASTYGKYAGGGGNYRRYRYEAHRSGGYGGGSYSAANGYGNNSKSAAYHKSHVNTNRGGLFISSADKSKSKGANHYYRDSSLPAPKRQTVHYKVRCCCFSFYWPPWGYEPTAPPTPIFYTRSTHGVPPPSSWGVTPQISPRPCDGGPPYIVPPSQHVRGSLYSSGPPLNAGRQPHSAE